MPFSKVFTGRWSLRYEEFKAPGSNLNLSLERTLMRKRLCISYRTSHIQHVTIDLEVLGNTLFHLDSKFTSFDIEAWRFQKMAN